MTAPAAKQARPLSPHLTVYRWQISMTLSILHRITGVCLTFGLPVAVAWVVAVAAGPQVYDMFVGLFLNPVGQILLFGWSWAFFYHFCTGIRHLFWDAGLFLSLKGMRVTGWISFLASTATTALIWAKLLEWI